METERPGILLSIMSESKFINFWKLNALNEFKSASVYYLITLLGQIGFNYRLKTSTNAYIHLLDNTKWKYDIATPEPQFTQASIGVHIYIPLYYKEEISRILPPKLNDFRE